MNPKLINYEKLCNKILVPRLNGVFSKYSDTRITEISIFDIPNSKAKDKFNHELYHIKVIVKYTLQIFLVYVIPNHYIPYSSI